MSLPVGESAPGTPNVCGWTASCLSRPLPASRPTPGGAELQRVPLDIAHNPRLGVGDPRGACETAGCEAGDRRGSCKTAGGKVNDLRGGCKTAGCKAPSEPARGPQGLLPRGCRAGESAGPARGLMLRGRRAGECAGAAAGAGEDEGADGAGTERPSSSHSHSVESSICAGGAGAEKSTNSRSHSSSAESPAGAAGGADAEKPTNSHSHSAESSSSGADGTAAMRQKGDKARASRPEGKATTR